MVRFFPGGHYAMGTFVKSSEKILKKEVEDLKKDLIIEGLIRKTSTIDL